MDLSKELFQAISEQAVKASTRLVDLPEEPNGVYGIILPDGTLQVCKPELPWRDHQAHSLSDFIAYVLNTVAAGITSGDPEAVTAMSTNVVVWYSRNGIIAILNDGASRQDHLTLPLTMSPQLLGLQSLERSGKCFSQKDFVALLRIQLANCLNGSPMLLSAVRNLKITANSSGTGVVEHTRRSVGQSIEQEVTGSGSIPETITVHLPVFENPNTRYDVCCAIEVDPNGPQFKLIPLPLQLEEAVRQAESDLGEQLSAALAGKVHVYYGVP